MIATIGRFFVCRQLQFFSSGRLSLHPIRAGLSPHPIRAGLSPGPIREQCSCKSRLNVLAQVACLRLRSAGWARAQFAPG